MRVQNIFTEHPEEEMWKNLLQFSFPVNIKKYLSDKGFTSNDDLVESISGCILQAYEYFNASKNANLQISPLLLYYGSTNLLYGMANLCTGKINDIKNHGMHIDLESIYKYIAETTIRFDNYENGGIHVFTKVMNIPYNLTTFGTWTVQELLGSIAEINGYYYKCYSTSESFVILVQETKNENGIYEKVLLDQYNSETFLKMFSQVSKVSDSYLNPTPTHNHINNSEYIILRHKINGKPITETSFSGQPYLQVAHKKNGNLITLPTLFYMYMILFAFCSLCRYNPEKWNPFVRNDSTGERLLVEEFLYYARRIIPNMILNHLYDCCICFVNEKYQINNTIKVVGEHEVKELVKHELYLQKRIDEVKNNGV